MNTRRSITAAAAALIAAGALTAAAAPASASRVASNRDSDGLSCANGVATLDVDYWQDDTTGHIVRIRASNGTSRRITFDEIYASSGHHRFESYDAIVGSVLTPGTDVYAGGNGPTHRLPYYLVGTFHASSNRGCRGSITVRLYPERNGTARQASVTLDGKGGKGGHGGPAVLASVTL